MTNILRFYPKVHSSFAITPPYDTEMNLVYCANYDTNVMLLSESAHLIYL